MPLDSLKKIEVTISPPKFERAEVLIRGTSPYVQHNFSQKARAIMEARQREGQRSRKGRQKEARDFEADYEAAKHVSADGWCGVPAPAFRNAMISACRTAGFAMTRAKLSIFVEADGYAQDGTPLVRISGEPEIYEAYARNESGVADIRWRPMWKKWEAVVKLRYDVDQFSAADVFNLLARAGIQVGIGEGRPDSPKSNGLGFGLWELVP